MDSTPTENHFIDIAAAVMGILILLALLTSFVRHFSDIGGAFSGWLESSHLGALPTVIMVVFILFDAALLGFIIFTMQRYARLIDPRPTRITTVEQINPTQEIQESWKNIESLIQGQSPSDWNMAILRADALLDNTLQDTGYAGETMADRLKIVDPTHLPSLDQVWSAHRLRNAIAHNPTDQHTHETIVSAIAGYRAAFQDLGFMITQPAAPENLPIADAPPDQASMNQKL